MEKPMPLYLDQNKIPKLISLVEEFSKQDLAEFWVDVGELNVGTSINWKSVVPYDAGGSWTVNELLSEKAKDIIDYVKTMRGIHRVTINYLQKYSFMPIHIDDETRPEYDTNSKYYNIIVSVNGHGWSIVDYKVIKNVPGEVLVFNGQVPHGAMNDTLETRITIYLIVEKAFFDDNS